MLYHQAPTPSQLGIAGIPMGTPGSADHIADVDVQLAPPDAYFANGAYRGMNSGPYMR
ncbi:hypothetical protein [Caballeronia hypogeia]|nr:hypothetical protein [Caballeronia hypogeia]